MATNTFQSIHHNTTIFNGITLSETPLISTLSSSHFLKPTTTTTKTTISLSHSNSSTITTFSLSPTTTSLSSPSTSSQPISFDLLQQHLSNQDFRQADEETRRLLIVLAGDAAKKRGYVFFSEVKFISETDLKAIDELWKKYSNNRFGYSVQKKIFEKVNKDFTNLFIKIGWMKKLDTEIEQYNYRAFPTEFIWELNDDTPQGHLPLTNALRGTQLFKCILTHPAFNNTEQEEQVVGIGDHDRERIEDKGIDRIGEMISKPLSKSVFKPDYSF